MARPIIKTKITTRTQGDPYFHKLLREARGIEKSYVSVGILEPERTYPDSDATVGQVALWQEFGTHDAKGFPIIPPRSFLRTPVDEGMVGIDALKTRLLRQIVDGKMSVQKGLESLGADIVRRMQSAITRRINPPLRPATLAERRKKGVKGTIPLKATRFLFDSIHFAVRSVGFFSSSKR